MIVSSNKIYITCICLLKKFAESKLGSKNIFHICSIIGKKTIKIHPKQKMHKAGMRY